MTALPQDIETSPIVLIATIFDEPLQLVNLAQSLVRIFLHLNKVRVLLSIMTSFLSTVFSIMFVIRTGLLLYY